MSRHPAPHARLGRFLVWICLLGISGQRLTAQPGSVDPTFSPGPPLISVARLAVQSDGRIYVAAGSGGFTNYLGAKANGFLRLHADGTPDPTFVTGAGFEGQRVVIPGLFTNVSLPQFNGVVATAQGVLVGGVFSAYDGVARTNLVRLLNTGALDGAFHPKFDNNVLAVAVQPDGKILVSGSFKNVNGTPRNSLARLHADGTLDTSFNPVWGGIVSANVRAIHVLPDGRILVGGTLTALNGASLAPIAMARLNADGSVDATFKGPALSFLTESIASILVQADGKIVVAGPFGSLAGTARKNLARLNADGTLDAAWGGAGAGAAGTETVEVVVPGANGQIYVGGKFGTLHGVGPGGIARLNADGTRDATFQKPAGSTTYQAFALAVQPDGKLLAGGIFTLGTTTESTKTVLRLITEGTVSVPPPQITVQPATQAIPVDANGRSLSVTATGSPPLSYQWFKNGASLPLKTEATLAFSQFRETEVGEYHVVVTNPGGSVTSVVASVTAVLPVAITAQPTDVVVGQGETATIAVGVSGTGPFTYQWRMGGAAIPGATGSTLVLPAVQLADAAKYSVVVANSLGEVISREAALVVTVPPPVLVRQPLSQVVTLAHTNLTAEILVGRRLRLTVAGALPPWIDRGTYDITFTANGYSSPAGGALATASTGIYSVGMGTAPLAWIVDFAGFFPDGQSAQLTLVPNGIFEFNRANLVADQNGRWELIPAFTPAAGPTVTFSVEASGVGPITYQWRKDGGPLVGQTGATLTLDDVQAAHLGDYTVDVTGPGGTVSSAVATLSTAPSMVPVTLGDPTLVNGSLQFGVPTVAGATYDVQFRTALGSAEWGTLRSITGDGSVVPVTIPTRGASGFLRVAQRP